MLRTAILLPRSTLFPSLAIDILNGFKKNLERLNFLQEIQLVTDNIGFGVNEAEIYSKAEKLLLQEDMDVVIVCADIKIAELLQPLFTASNKILIMLHMGANFPESWQPAPTTITHTLNFCLHAALTGELAAKESNKEAVNVVSYYDGGYRQCFSMLYAHQLNGGLPLFNHITHIKLDEFTLEPVSQFLEQQPSVKNLLCLFSGAEAEKFYREIEPLQKKQELHLFVSPMMLDVQLQNAKPALNLQQVKGYVPWQTNLVNKYNQLFNTTIQSATGKPANYFSLLGWETATLMAEIIKQQANGNNNAAAVISSLTEKKLESPRGWMQIDAATHHTYAPSYLCTAIRNMEVRIINEKENITEAWKNFSQQKMPQAESSGWKNNYLCI